MNDYWKDHWSNLNFSRGVSLQEQVARTKNRTPVDIETWNRTVDFIGAKMGLNSADVLLDLCSGNGLLTIPFSKSVKHVTAIDISEELLSIIDGQGIDNVDTIRADITCLKLNKEVFSKVALYFSLQYFDDSETLNLLNNIYKWLKSPGVAYIGDIPDIFNIWKFFRTDEQKKAYFGSVINDRPIIGNWFSKAWLKNYCESIGFKVKILEQPKFMFNSSYRFDLLLKK